MEQQQKLISLYDYLGHAAGKDLGKQVHSTAVKLKEPVETREVSTRTYTGLVCLYRKEFLQEYFSTIKKGTEDKIEPTLGDIQNYQL
jgi:hypothetical protein